MSYNFLDKDGLSYFWNKIKAKFVTLDTAQTITGAKTFNSTLKMSNINNATYTTSTTQNIRPDAVALSNPPWNKDLWHDHFALLRHHSIDSRETTADGTTWTTSTKNINNLFLGKEQVNTTILNTDERAFRFVLKNTNFAYSGVSWFEIAVGYSNPFSSFNVLIEYSTDNSTWVTCHNSTITGNSSPYFLRNTTSFSGDGYLRFTLTKTSNLDTGKVVLKCLKAMCTRKGDQGLGSEYELPYDWDINSNLLPIANNTKNLGSSSAKWANVYATTFNGALSGNATSATSATSATTATKATQDSDGNAINTTYVKKSADGMSAGINQLTTGSSTPTDNDYYVSQYVGGGTTTTSYHRRPMSALWEYIKSKINADGYTKNSGTVTSVAVKMNNTTKGTVTTSGTIDLGTVITAHQDISGLAPKASPALTGTPTAPTATAGTNTTQIATTAFVQTAVSGKVDKENGKGLSTNDYTTDEKTLLSGLGTYSNTEVAVGTWLNGQTIYRKVISGTPSAQNSNVQHNVTNFGAPINCYGFYKRNSDSAFEPIPGTYTNWETWIYDFTSTKFTLRFSNNAWNSGIAFYNIVLEYIKSGS